MTRMAWGAGYTTEGADGSTLDAWFRWFDWGEFGDEQMKVSTRILIWRSTAPA